MSWWNKKQLELEGKIKVLEQSNSEMQSSYMRRENWYPVITERFDGEKTPGEMGVYKNLLPHHDGLRWRSYEANLKSDIVKIITGKFFKWVIGVGLKLQSEPNTDILSSEGITLAKDFVLKAESRFSVFSKSKFSCYSQMTNLHDKAAEAYETAFLGGDCLCVLRIDDKGNVNMQVIDGSHIKSPAFQPVILKEIKERGNTLESGIELSPTGEHISFYVLVKDDNELLGKYERIESKGEKTGRLMAWMVYSSKHRIDHVRGIPMLTAILEKVEKLDRYTEAAVGSAEERAKIVFAIEHNKDSDGENPLIDKARQAAGLSNNAAKETSGWALGEKSAATIAATTSKQTFNMPVGASLKSLDSKTELQFDTFSKSVFYFLCAAVDIPPEVALQQYEQNYSSSRAAINGWDYIVKVYRQKFSAKFYQPFYNLWLEIQILQNKIPAIGFINALRKNDFMIIESYSSARFTGANMPHIDPLKEVKAVREMLGSDAPLISHEKAAEILGEGDWAKNIEKYKQEQKLIPEKDEQNNSQNRQQNQPVVAK